MHRFLYASLFVGLTALLATGAATVSAFQPQPPPIPTTKAAAPGAPATLTVIVPPDAEIEIEGAKTTSTGQLRRYKSPPLQLGAKYHYTIKATWMENGKPRTLELQVPVSAGTESAVDFIKEAAKPPMKDTPPKDTPPKDTPPKDTPAKDTPKKDTPAKDLPPKDLPPKDLPAKDLPVKDKDKQPKDSDK
jgi:uncharacterized protein (TIGR03000 family)